MFRVSDLNNNYGYDFSAGSFHVKIFDEEFNRKNPFQITGFINEFMTANEWPWDEITFYNCKRLEYLIQEKLPENITKKKEVYKWIVRNWKKFNYSGSGNVSLN